MTINAERLLADLHSLREFGREGTGVHRPALSDADMTARRWLMTRMAEAGLEPVIDGLGNVLGRSPIKGPAILIGSHTDTVPHGGWLDGALGVIYALEVARSLPEIAIDVINFQDEEGTYSSCAGSLAFTGQLQPADLVDRRNAEGQSLTERLTKHGLIDDEWLTPDLSHYRGFLEAHIEQGPVLEREGGDIAIVTGIVGAHRWRLEFKGQADHAGTTPMAMRRDAGAAMFRLANRLLDEFAAAAGPDTVWNLGHAALGPGASNVVPARAELFVEYRDIDQSRIDQFAAILKAAIQAVPPTIDVSAAQTMSTKPTPMSDTIIDLFEAASEACQKHHRRLASGAGHDAMYLAPHMPSGMIFIPSIGGRSHDVAENSHDRDIIAGCEVMAKAAELLVTQTD